MKELGCRAVIFDKDGTLVDTETLNFEMFDRLLQLYGARHDADTHGQMMGRSDLDVLRILQKRHRKFPQGETNLTRLQRRMWEIHDEVRRERGVIPMSGATELLKLCRAADVPIAIATSARRVDTEEQFDLLGWDGYFQAIVTSDDVTTHKPSPEVYVKACAFLGLAPQECLAIEDSPNGVASAVSAGMKVVFVRDARFGLAPPPGATQVIACLDELLQ